MEVMIYCIYEVSCILQGIRELRIYSLGSVRFFEGNWDQILDS